MGISEYKAAVYTELVIYAGDDDSRPQSGAPFIVAPAEVHEALSPDVAPYGTSEPMYGITDAALRGLRAPNLPEASRAALERLLAWTDEVDGIWAWYQLEPREIAGQATANIETDTSCPGDGE